VEYTKGLWNWYKEAGLTFDKVDAVCIADFWARLEWMHDGKEIMLSLCPGIAIDRVYLLTTPMQNPESTTGKLTWVEQQLNKCWRNRTIVTAARKSLFARPGALLIDDRDENVEEFRAAGGDAILVPRPWNASWKYALQSVDIVKLALQKRGLCD
jgi:5'(3')-deoxyribonucleotidase